jgi:transposase InsO family protein
VPRKKIREVLKLHGLTGSRDSSFDNDKTDNGNGKSSKGSRRFEASYPRELYQMDITYVYLANDGVYYLVIILDDYSRFCVCSELRRDQQGLSMIEVLHRAIERYGKPTKLLTDQGSSFYSWSSEQTLFSRYLDDMKIEHIVADPHSPQTLGKVERLNQTVKRELLKKVHFSSYQEACDGICDYFHQYNYSRPHQGIGGAIPVSRFQGIIAETSRIESGLCGHGLDFSRGYLVFKMPMSICRSIRVARI